MKNIIVTIFGGTGFIGSDIVRVLARQGYIIRIAEKNVKRADRLKFNGQVGQIIPVACDYTQKSIESAIDGASIVINCTGILAENGHRSFMATHCYLPETIAKACAKFQIHQFIHISAMGIEANKSHYSKSKLAGEKQVLKAFDKVTFVRPSIVFGAGDGFFNMFAAMARVSPILPLIGGGKTLFQPVYVGDVADVIAASIQQKYLGIIECGGPDILSFADLLKKMLSITGQKPCLLPLPVWIAKIQAVILSILPNPPITLDQIKSLQYDNVVTNNAKTMSDLGVKQTSLDAILPCYLERYKK